MRNSNKRASGFSLVELLVVVAIMLVVAAMATPRVVAAMDDIRLRSSLRDLIGLAQQARELAIKNNDYYQLLQANNTMLYIDGPLKDQQGNTITPRDAVRESREAATQLPGRVTITAAGAPAFGANLGNGAIAVPGGALPAFNARGQACFPQGATCTTRQGGGFVPGASGATVAYVFFLRQQRTFGQPVWGAISVAPGGRMKSWVFDNAGNQWVAQ